MTSTIETFNFFLPASVVKSGTDKDGRRWIQGIASTDHMDLQNEKVAQKGIEYDYFLKYGYINDDHKSGPEHKVGEPTEARITDKGFWIKGFLYKGKERADYWWEHLTSLEQSRSNRKVGFSIQGKVKKRKGSKIEKCWIQDVAITASPVNTNTWAEIAKSLAETDWEDEDKALSASSPSGRALSPESLEGSNKITTYKSFKHVPQDADLSYDEYVLLMQIDKGFSRAAAEAVVDCIWINKGLK